MLSMESGNENPYLGLTKYNQEQEDKEWGEFILFMAVIVELLNENKNIFA